MKQILQIILALTLLTFGCQPIKKQENVNTADSSSNNTIEPEEAEQTGSIDNPKDFDKFDILFEHKNKEQNFRQRLGVTWLTKDSIEFRLLTEDELCDTDYRGNAKNNNVDMDPETDEDENGDSYAASEYVTEQNTYTLSIRISLDKDKARIIYTDKSGEDTDCIPTPDLVLEKKNAH